MFGQLTKGNVEEFVEIYIKSGCLYSKMIAVQLNKVVLASATFCMFII